MEGGISCIVGTSRRRGASVFAPAPLVAGIQRNSIKAVRRRLRHGNRRHHPLGVARWQCWSRPFGYIHHPCLGHDRHRGGDFSVRIYIGERLASSVALVIIFIHKLAVLAGNFGSLLLISSGAVIGGFRLVFVGLRSPVDARQAMGAISPCPTSNGSVDTLPVEMGINGTCGGGPEFKGLGTRSLMCTSLSDVQSFGFERLDAKGVRIVLGRDTKGVC